MSYSVNEIIAYSHNDDETEREREREKKEHHEICVRE
jgi:hypothetical protein